MNVRAELCLLQNDMESAGADLEAVELLYDPARDSVAVNTSRLLGMLAEGLSLLPEAETHYTAAQDKLAALAKLHATPGRSRYLPKVQTLLLRHLGTFLRITPSASI